MTDKLSVILIGAGNMGGAMFQSWVRAGILDPTRSAVITPNPKPWLLDMSEETGIPINPVDDGEGYDIAVVAVKPQMFADVLPGLSWPNMEKTIFVSVAAGLPIGEIENILKSNIAEPHVVRGMPNLPVSVGEGLTLMASGQAVNEAEQADVKRLLACAGDVIVMDEEDGLDRYVGTSGSGTALALLLVEAMEDAAMSLGADEAAARRMAEQVFVGAAELLKQDDRPAAELRAAVTSKGGTTAAGLAVLDDKENGLRPLMKRAVDAAYARARDLAGK
jgi:pyrroline-5-carboxylate reductase